MPFVLASAHLSDEEFLEAFHSCRLPNSEFHHADHLRLRGCTYIASGSKPR